MFKYALRQCKRNEEAIRADEHAKSLFDKDMVLSWKKIYPKRKQCKSSISYHYWECDP